jgi:hypothetical protein
MVVRQKERERNQRDTRQRGWRNQQLDLEIHHCTIVVVCNDTVMKAIFDAMDDEWMY